MTSPDRFVFLCTVIICRTTSLIFPAKLLHRYTYGSNTFSIAENVRGKTWNSSLFGKATMKDLLFPLTSQQSFVRLPGDLFNNFTSVSFEAWTNKDSKTNDTALLIFGNLSISVDSSFAVSKKKSTGIVKLSWDDTQGTTCAGNCHKCVSTYAFNPHFKLHVVVTIASSDYLRLYVNGVLACRTPTVATSLPHPNSFNLGKDLVPTTEINNDLVEFRIWGGILSSTEIKNSFIKGPAGILLGKILLID